MEHENKNTIVKQRLIEAIAELDTEHTTSVSLYNTYWLARTLLRALTLDRYEDVFEYYRQRELDVGFPMEGYEEIFKDTSEMIETILKYKK